MRMRTVHPSTMIGAYGFEPDRIPRDEFQIRMSALNGIMDAKGCSAVLVYGDAREHSDLANFTNFIPRHRWALALLPRRGEPRLLVSMSSRDMPAQRLMTWIPDVMSAWTWDSVFDPWLAGLGADAPQNIGTVRFDLMRPPLMASLEKSLGNRFRLVAADAEVRARPTRPRELSLIRDACGVVRAGAAAFMQAWRDGQGIEAAALAGERSARALAAQDVRTLVSFDGGRTLAPFRGAFEPKPRTCLSSATSRSSIAATGRSRSCASMITRATSKHVRRPASQPRCSPPLRASVPPSCTPKQRSRWASIRCIPRWAAASAAVSGFRPTKAASCGTTPPMSSRWATSTPCTWAQAMRKLVAPSRPPWWRSRPRAPKC